MTKELSAQKKVRSSGIELLRIIIMMQIIFLHMYLYGDYKVMAEAVGPNHLIASRLLWIACRTPVNIFIIISGYFMVNKSFDLKSSYRKIPKLYIQIIFYSIGFFLIFYILKPEVFKSTGDMLRSFFPLLSRLWYFVSIYFVLLLLSPFVNIAIQTIDKRQYQILLVICFFLFSIWPNLSDLKPINETISVWRVINTEEGKSLYSFLFMYIIGGYLRRFSDKPEKVKYKYLLLFIFLCLIDLSIFIYSRANQGGYNKLFGRYDNPFVVVESVMLFLFFQSINFYSKTVNRIASTTLGVYLIHEQKHMRYWIWSLFGTGRREFYNGYFYFVKLLLIVLTVFFACSLIDFLRQYLFLLVEKAIFKIRKAKQ